MNRPNYLNAYCHNNGTTRFDCVNNIIVFLTNLQHFLYCSWLSLISIHHFTAQVSTSHNTITRIIRDDNIIVAVILHLEVMLRKPPRNSYRWHSTYRVLSTEVPGDDSTISDDHIWKKMDNKYLKIRRECFSLRIFRSHYIISPYDSMIRASTSGVTIWN